MCGIIGYVGEKLAVPIVVDCLKALEYRGYDSAGIAYVENQNLNCVKRVGKLQNLSVFLKNKIIPVSCAIGHTRWATHGEPREENAHPQIDNNNIVAVVHNGIIENYLDIKSKLIANGVKFYSETDTEVISQYLSHKLCIKSLNSTMHNTLHSTIKPTKNEVINAIKEIMQELNGAYAIGVVIKGIDDCIFFAKRNSPLVLGKGYGENFLASDTPALINYAQKFYTIQDDEFGYITKNKIVVYNQNFKIKKLKYDTIKIKAEQVILGKFNHFMEKEIEQGAQSVIDTIDRINNMQILQKIPAQIFEQNFNLHITACGTALHAGMIAKYIIENQLKIPVDLDYASEFRYKQPILNEKSICLFISQSGETADTLSCLELSKSLGATTIAFTNVPASRMEKIADYVVPTSAGVEIAVASTKAYMAQIASLYAFIEYLAKILQKPIKFNSELIKNTVLMFQKREYASIQEITQEIKDENSVYFLGRGLDYLLALEGALKLKEVSYIHCEAMPAGELKHGSLALIHKGSIVIAILTQKNLIEKTANNIHELNSRGAKIILFSPFSDLQNFVYKQIFLPEVENLLAPFIAMKPLQILAYKTAIAKNLDPDKPRNLAKSVTVE